MKKIKKDSYTEFKDIWNDKNLLTKAEKDFINFETALVGKLIKAREKKGFTQKGLASLTGIKQSAIARLESIRTTPQVNTLFKLLKPLGYTLEIVPIKYRKAS
jgi:ribosome-binding protein aMBF1 (putative translation factor)